MITSMSASGPCLIRFSSSMPSSLGIFRSVTTTSKRSGRRAVSRASSPSAAVDHLVALGRQVVGQGDPLDLFVVGDQDFHQWRYPEQLSPRYIL